MECDRGRRVAEVAGELRGARRFEGLGVADHKDAGSGSGSFDPGGVIGGVPRAGLVRGEELVVVVAVVVVVVVVVVAVAVAVAVFFFGELRCGESNLDFFDAPFVSSLDARGGVGGTPDAAVEDPGPASPAGAGCLRESR